MEQTAPLVLAVIRKRSINLRKFCVVFRLLTRAAQQTALLVADCLHRIDSGSSAGGQIASKECRNNQG